MNPNGHNQYPPGYPQANPSQPMGGVPQGPPGGYPNAPYPGMAAPPRPEPAPRKGSARTLPIVAGVGMAVGVFGGLMIIFGTGKSDAASDADTKPVVTAQVSDAGAAKDDPMAKVTPDGDGDQAGTMEAADAAPAAPEPKSVVLAFEVEPSDARITVDGEEVDGDSFTIELDPDEKRKKVKVEAKSDGYRSWSKTIAVNAEMDEKTVSIELNKIIRRPAKKRRSGGGGRRNNTRRGGPGGLIDL